KTPYELLYGKPPDLTRLKKFGCKVFALIPQPNRGNKLKDVSIEGMFVGYDQHSKGYRIWVPNKRALIVARDVLFREGENWKSNDAPATAESSNRDIFDDIVGPQDLNIPAVEPEGADKVYEPSRPDEGNSANKETPEEDEPAQEEENPTLPALQAENSRFWYYTNTPPQPTQEEVFRQIELHAQNQRDNSNIRATRSTTRNQNLHSVEYLELYYTNAEFTEEPKSFDDALEHRDADNWNQAMEEEMASFKAHDVYELVERQPWMNVIGGKWVFAYNVNNNTVAIEKVDTNSNPADILTKELQGAKLQRLRNIIGVISLRGRVEL
ncbi:hypothetical protein SeLEV6574_g07877, partial [Synchytrium endobioticum]